MTNLPPMEPVEIPPGVEVVRDMEFGMGGGRPLRMHLLLPPKRPAGGTTPAVVYIYGGWWRAGAPDNALMSRSPHGSIAVDLAAHGYVVAAVEYRLSQESVFPAQIHDCKCGVRFLRAHASQLGIDPARIGSFGPSAGGHLSALLGTSAGVAELEGDGGWPEQRSDVQAVVDWYGPTDILQPDAGHAEPGSPGEELLGGPVLEHRAAAERVNPAAYIRSGCPPFLIMHGEVDTVVPASQSVLLHEALIKAGVESELQLYPGKGHEHLGPEAAQRVLAFFDRHLRGGS